MTSSPTIVRRPPGKDGTWPDAMLPLLRRIYAARGVVDVHGAHPRLGQLLSPELLHNSRVAAELLADAIAALRTQDGKPIIAHGGAAFARSLIAHNLADEYVLGVYPILLGKGVPIFNDLPAPRPLTLVSTHTFPSGFMAQTYRPA